jgi:hypothetical protein
MIRFKVLVHAENFFIPVENKYRKAGFYTAVFVSSLDSCQAGEMAVRFLREDRALLASAEDDPEYPPLINAIGIEEVDGASETRTERTGLAFYWE